LDASAIMYAFVSFSTCSGGSPPVRADDLSGIRFIYPSATSTSAPGPPSGLVASSSGSTVVLAWAASTTGGAPAVYVIEAGSSPGAANLANFSTGNTLTSFSASGVGAGRYYVRVKAANAAGTSGPSNEALLVVGGAGCAGAPGAPTGFTITTNTSATVAFSWNAASGNPTTYIIEAGSIPGATNLANSDLGSSATSYSVNGVGRGTYYVRLRARNACGTSGVSNEVVLVR
jgi:predicted phage tail protein